MRLENTKTVPNLFTYRPDGVSNQEDIEITSSKVLYTQISNMSLKQSKSRSLKRKRSPNEEPYT